METLLGQVAKTCIRNFPSNVEQQALGSPVSTVCLLSGCSGAGGCLRAGGFWKLQRKNKPGTDVTLHFLPPSPESQWHCPKNSPQDRAGSDISVSDNR